jgi:hypothetical protein
VVILARMRRTVHIEDSLEVWYITGGRFFEWKTGRADSSDCLASIDSALSITTTSAMEEVFEAGFVCS